MQQPCSETSSLTLNLIPVKSRAILFVLNGFSCYDLKLHSLIAALATRTQTSSILVALTASSLRHFIHLPFERLF